MRQFCFTLLLLWGIPCLAADVVHLTEGKHSVKATIGDEVFTVMQFSDDRKKPFFLPVTAAGGIELLKAGKPDAAERVPGRKDIICSERPQVTNQEAGLGLNDVVEISDVIGHWLKISDKECWIHRSDVAPIAATVTRLINDNPPRIKDRSSPLYYDHPHHKGIWLSVDEVNGIKFWNEDGEIRTKSVEIVTAKGNPAVLKRTTHWLGENGKPLVEEVSTWSLYANRLITADITFTAQTDVTFGDTKEGMFAIRLPNSMREMVSGGPVNGASGDSGSGELWGKLNRWIDYCGPVGNQTFGVTLMDHPQNPRPSRYHVRNYGLFAINPFGQKSYTGGNEKLPANPLELAPGESTRFRYGLFVHSGTTEPKQVEAAFQQFVSQD